MTYTHAVATNAFGPAAFIVDATASNGTHTTIASALTAAVSGQTIFIKPGTYTENLTLKAGVNLVAYTADSLTPNVIILGKCTATFAGTASISGIQLKTNSDFCLAVTGSSATIINITNCFILANNNTAISFTSSSSSSQIRFWYSKLDTLTTGITLFAHSAAGVIKFLHSYLENNGVSITASTVSGTGDVDFWNSFCAVPITTSSTSSFTAHSTNINQPLILGGTGSNKLFVCDIDGGSSSAVSVGTGATVTLASCSIGSSNTNAISGAGTVIYSGISFAGTSTLINTTAQTPAYMNLGKWKATGQPAFLAFLGTTDTNFSGDNTVFTIGSGNALTEVFDIGNNFVTTGTLTAPETSIWQLQVSATVSGGTLINAGDLKIVTSNRSYRVVMSNGPGATTGVDGNLVTLADMDAADTATFTVNTNDTGGKIDDLIGGASPYLTFISGIMVS